MEIISQRRSAEMGEENLQRNMIRRPSSISFAAAKWAIVNKRAKISGINVELHDMRQFISSWRLIYNARRVFGDVTESWLEADLCEDERMPRWHQS